MARPAHRLWDNAPGEFFVDDACIDCETCRIVAPEVFGRSDELGMSVVHAQPRSEHGVHRAKMALVACPTSAIGTESKLDVSAAARAFPEPIAGTDVHYCGFAAESSYGASSYLVVRPEGNVLVDSPRAARPLIDCIEALGGVHTMVLSHRDDVADHATYARRFGSIRVMHAADIVPATRGIERVIEGDEPVALAPDLLVIPVPGHTQGSVALLYRNFLFTGDHLWGSEDGERLEPSREVCWYSWAAQTRSMRQLLSYDFAWVLPGHGRRLHAEPPVMRRKLEELLSRMAPEPLRAT